MIRMGAVRHALKRARLWKTVHLLSYALWLCCLAVLLMHIPQEHRFFQRWTVIYSFLSSLIVFLDSGLFKKPLRNATKAYQDAFLQCYGPFVLGPIFPELELWQGKGVCWDTIADTKMIFPGSFVESQSLIRAQYRGIPFELSATRTVCFGRRLYRRGWVQVEKSYFRGWWTVISLNSAYRPALQIIQSGFKNKRKRRWLLVRYRIGRRVSTKSFRFNLKFRVYARDRDNVDSVLTPDVMKQIRYLASRVNGKLMLGLVDGKLHIAVQARRNAVIAPSVFLPFRDEMAVAYLQRRIEPFTQLIDELSRHRSLVRPITCESIAWPE